MKSSSPSQLLRVMLRRDLVVDSHLVLEPDLAGPRIGGSWLEPWSSDATAYCSPQGTGLHVQFH